MLCNAQYNRENKGGNMSKEKRRNNTIQYRAFDAEYEMLNALVGVIGHDKSEVLRYLVEQAHNQLIKGEENA